MTANAAEEDIKFRAFREMSICTKFCVQDTQLTLIVGA